MSKIIIKNRKWDNLVVLVDETKDQKWLVFVMHGLGWYKEQPHVKTFANAFKDNWYTTIMFDTTCSFGESWWEYENATTTWYYNDLEDIISWAETQNWYEDKFALVWHSLWWISTAMFAEKYPEKVIALAPISTVVSWLLSVETKRYEWNDILQQRKKYDILIRRAHLNHEL